MRSVQSSSRHPDASFDLVGWGWGLVERFLHCLVGVGTARVWIEVEKRRD